MSKSRNPDRPACMKRCHMAGKYAHRIAFRSSVDGISLLGNHEIGIGEWIHHQNRAVLLSIGQVF
jgi:hypothetical protein